MGNETANSKVLSYQDILSAMPFGSVICKCNENIEIVCSNPAMWALFECESEDEFMSFYKGSFVNLLAPVDRIGMINTIKEFQRLSLKKTHRSIYRIITKYGRIIEVEDCGGVLVNDSKNSMIICVLSEVGGNKPIPTDMNDRLTGLFNMNQFLSFADDVLRKADEAGDFSEYTIIYNNVRNFKFYNMKYGRQAGDRLLQDIADLIRVHGTEMVVARLNDDHFVSISKDQNVYDVVAQGNKLFDEKYKSMGIVVKTGLYRVTKKGTDIAVACDLAKAACNLIHDTSDSVMIYNEKMEQRISLENYIIQNFEDALEKGYFIPFYQPIIRSLTKGICNSEILVRWQDPLFGNISAKDFIPVLEKSGLITKLDLNILHQICKNVQIAESNGNTVPPISWNISKIDLIKCDICMEIEKAISEYQLPRELINIEISESVVAENPGFYKVYIEQLRANGYQVWLDNFGSSISSLNLLRDIHFDAVKLDMVFLHNFDERSKEMVRSAVHMLKRMGIQTIAEGIETKEQYEFLRSIGCEKMQGSFIAKPMSRHEVSEYVLSYGIPIEKRRWRQYYDAIGRTNFSTDRSLGIVEYDGTDFSFLFMNDDFKSICHELEIQDEKMLTYLMNDPSSALSKKFRCCGIKLNVVGDTMQMDYSLNGRYFRLQSRCICRSESKIAFHLEIILLGQDEVKISQLDHIFGTMAMMYDTIFLIHPDGSFENLLTRDNHQKSDKSFLSREKLQYYVHPEDRQDFLNFTDMTTLKQRLLATRRGYDTHYFRTNYDEAVYIWRSHTIQYIAEMDMFIYSTKAAPLYQIDMIEKLAPGFLTQHIGGLEGALWYQLMNSDTISIVWKDSNRVIHGANKHYLDILSLDKISSIIGKKDEEMHWLLNDQAIQDDINVIQNGVSIHNRIEKYIVNGRVCTVLASKEPIYMNEKIVGMFTWFISMDELNNQNRATVLSAEENNTTGVLSVQEIFSIVSDYVGCWISRKENFAVIRLDFQERNRNYAEYGSDISTQIGNDISEIIEHVCGNEALAAKLYIGSYVILKRCKDSQSVYELKQNLEKIFKNTHTLAGVPVTLYPDIQLYFAEQMENPEELISIATGGSEKDFAVRKQLEDKLNYYNIQLETVVDAIPGGIAMYELRGHHASVVYASKGVGEISGNTTEKFKEEFKKNYSGNMVAQDVEMVREAVWNSVDKKTELNVTCRLHHTDGRIIWVNMRGRIIGEQNGNPLMLVVFRNLSEDTSIYETIIDKAKVGVIVTAEQTGEILYANRSINMFRDCYFGCSLVDMNLQLEALCTEKTKTYSVGIDDADSAQHEVEFNGRNLVLYHTYGNWNGREAHIWYITDITAQYIEEREKAARESLLYLQAISTSYDIIVAYNLTKDTYEIRYNNQYLGYEWTEAKSYSEMMTRIFKIVPENVAEIIQDNCSVTQQLKKYYEGQRSFEFEHQAYDIHGVRHWVVNRLLLVEDPANGDILGMSMSMVIDKQVRERNDQRETLQAALDEAKRANQAKSRFLSNMSHDIRTPMNAIMGYTSIAATHIDDKEMVENCLKKIVFSGKHLQELINDVLDMSRIEAGKDVLELRTFSTDELIEETVSMIKPVASDKRLTLNISTEKIRHHYIYADQSKLRRMMVNILSNAVKFTPKGGTVSIIYAEQRCQKEGYGRYIFAVRDNGIGMSSEFLENLFEAFSRERTSTISKQSGTGLGMAIVKRYVDMMGGKIIVNSKQNEGTQICTVIDLKLAHPVENNALSESIYMRNFAGKHLLLVEDNKLNREMASIVLSDMGFKVDTVSDGQQAIDLLKDCADDTYDFVLMDIQMPVMDGVTATKIIRASERMYLHRLPIIALTANVFSEDIQKYLDAGMNGHIAKPFDAESLTKMLSKIC